ncbi:AAA family ATPase [Thermoactinospora rubra]|uniref:AAA family ATPase n=1 Tax=Thermoactinospora rubra TaxID=1088767 RepID=UPI000A11EDD2|nr:ATP-binding protein [Thermoactinospora rubra]
MDVADARSLALALKSLLQQAHHLVDESQPPPELYVKVSDHVGGRLRDLVSVTLAFPEWEHVNLQRGVDAYLAAHSPQAEWFGVSGHGREHTDFMNLLAVSSRWERYEIGAVDYRTAATGPDEAVEVVTFGLVLTRAPDGAPIVLGMRGPAEMYGMEGCRVEILAASRSSATAARAEIERLMREHDVYRGQVLTFGFNEHRGNSVVSFFPRPALRPQDVILPEGVLETVERHVIGIAEHAEALRAHGQHLKRGLLLHGPPGTGKTHTVRYLMSRLPGVTVIVMSGPAMQFIGQAAGLARRLQPAVVVLEDVDLVAQDRSLMEDSSPLLFTLFDAMDGIGGDADVTFVLTTNRPEVLEDALANRPGRIDLAVEVPRPDAEARRALLRLYSRDLELRADLEPIVARTEGMTASFFKELLRRAVLVALREDGRVGALTDGHLSAALEEMMASREALTRSLLGSAPGDEEEGQGEEPPGFPAPGIAAARPGRVFLRPR